MMKTKSYKHKDLTVTFTPSKCMHSEHCWRELQAVFDPQKRPWIQLEGVDPQRIIDQVRRCPSGALNFSYDNQKANQMTNQRDSKGSSSVKMQDVPNGPVMIKGNMEWEKSDGEKETLSGPVALCRCGSSGNKPFCDGTHDKVGFRSDQ